MTLAPHHQTFRGNEASDGAGLCARYSTLRTEILCNAAVARIRQFLPTICAGAREVGIAVSVSLFCALPVGLVVVSRLLWESQF